MTTLLAGDRVIKLVVGGADAVALANKRVVELQAALNTAEDARVVAQAALAGRVTAVEDGKASASAVTALTTALAGKADTTAVNAGDQAVAEAMVTLIVNVQDGFQEADADEATARIAGDLADYYLGQVATGCFMPRAIDTSKTYAKSRDMLIMRSKAVNPKVGFARWKVESGFEDWPAAPANLMAVIEYPVGVFTYSNQNIAAGGAGPPAAVVQATNDTTYLDFNLTIPKGATAYVRALQTVTGSQGVMLRQAQHPQVARPGCYMQTGTGTAPSITSAFSGSPGDTSYPPVVFAAMIREPSFLIFSDSREDTGHEGARPPYFDNGVVTAAIGRRFGYASMAEAGSLIFNFIYGNADSTIPARNLNRRNLSIYFSHVFCGWGINDLSSSRSPAQVWNDRSLFTAMFGSNKPIVGGTIMPYTVSGDGWATIAGQALTNTQPLTREANRLIRKGVPGEAYLIDSAAAVDPSDRGKWPVSADPSATTALSTATITASIATSGVMTVTAANANTLGYGVTLTDKLSAGSFTGTPYPGTIIREQLSGTPGGVGTYTVEPAPLTAVTSRTMYAGAYATQDGIHPTGLMAEQALPRVAIDLNQVRR